MKITLKMLEGACEPQRDLFAKLFGQEVELTLALCIEHAAKFNLYWAAQNFLPPKSQAAFNKARESAGEAYDKACATASEAYYKAIATAFFNAATMEEK